MNFDSIVVNLFISNAGKVGKLLKGYVSADKINISAVEINNSICPAFYIDFSENWEENTLELKDSDGFSIGEFTFLKCNYIEWKLNCNTLTDPQLNFMWDTIWARHGIDVCIQVDKPVMEEIKGCMTITDGKITATYIDYPLIENAKRVAYETEGLNPTIRARRIIERYAEANNVQV